MNKNLKGHLQEQQESEIERFLNLFKRINDEHEAMVKRHKKVDRLMCVVMWVVMILGLIGMFLPVIILAIKRL